MRGNLILGLTAAALALPVLVACGDDDAEAPAVTPRQAVAEIAEVRAGLQAGLSAYRAGNAQRADTLVGDAYLEHFELVEVPLEERDHELTEELEELIREELRGEIQAGAPVAAIERLVSEAQAGLNEAERTLQGN